VNWSRSGNFRGSDLSEKRREFGRLASSLSF
jgi:hypothetical protein